ncbi:hypothetical protein [Mesorhizobium cantuariense]|uniref:Uncharacterized protein n=1 Tax=Mesorhizobium cantuariense TaxID=1300275 RepID=A0ABV7MZX8_9HYPH
MNAAAEQSHISANAPQDAPGEQAQAAEAETGGHRGDEPARDIAAVAAPQVLPEPEWLILGGIVSPQLITDISDFVSQGLFPAERELFQHQFRALDASMREGRDAIVASATG